MFEGYDVPAEVLAEPGEPLSWDRIFAAWALVEYSFAAVLHFDLDAGRGSRSWRWFLVRLRGLLATPSPLSRHFAPQTAPELEEPSDGS